MRKVFCIFSRIGLFLILACLLGLCLQPALVQAAAAVVEPWVFTAENPNSTTDALLKAWACSSTELYVSDRSTYSLYHYSGGTFQKIFTSASQIAAIGGTSCTDVVIVTQYGSVYQYDGTNWTTLYNTYKFIYRAWIYNATAIYGMGNTGMAVFDGNTWTTMPNSSGDVLAVWGSSPSDVFAVGNQGLIMHYNGTVWSKINPYPGDSYGAVWGRGPSDVYVSGLTGKVLHYNGSTWTAIRPGTLYDAFLSLGGDATTLFAAGYAWNGPVQVPMLEMYDGSTWTPANAKYASPYYWAITSYGSDVFLAGEVGAVLHYNGSTWEELSYRVAVSDLTSAWGSGPNDIFAVGKMNPYIAYNSKTNTILHYDGSAWANLAPNINVNYTGVWGSGPNDVYAVGDPSNVSNPAVFHYNGVQWSAVATTTVRAPTYAIWGSGPQDIFVLGADASQNVGIHHFDGTSWSKMTTPALPPLYAIWGSGPNDVFAVGFYGVLAHYDGSQWTEMTGTGSPTTLNGVWGSGPNDVYAVGNGGLSLHYNGTSWALQPQLGSEDLLSIWGTSSKDIYIGSNYIWFYHYNGSTWNKVSSPVTAIKAIWGTEAGQIRLFGKNGQIAKASLLRYLFAPSIQR